jgi:hypothetical protein
MAVVAPSGNGTHTSVPKNNGATVVNAGNASTTGPITKILGLNTLADDVGNPIGSKVVSNDGTGAATTDRVGVSGVIASAAIAYEAGPTEWVMQGVTTTLAGVARTALLSQGSDFDGSVKDFVYQTNSNYTHGSGNGTFDIYARPGTDITPNYTKGGNAGAKFNFVRPSGNGLIAASDEAAAPTRAVPGELVYRFGAPTPYMDNYKAKDSYES